MASRTKAAKEGGPCQLFPPYEEPAVVRPCRTLTFFEQGTILYASIHTAEHERVRSERGNATRQLAGSVLPAVLWLQPAVRLERGCTHL